MSEIERKLMRIRAWLMERNLDGLYLQRVSSFAWATCGAASYINTASSYGESSLLITPEKQYLLTNNIEAPRLEKEEGLLRQGWDFRVSPWHAGQDEVHKLTTGLHIGADSCMPGAVDLSSEVARLRASLSPEEGERFRQLGQQCAQAMDAAAQSVHPGQTEHEIAGLLTSRAEAMGVQVTVILIATDERIFQFRHPLPTVKKLERYAMLILCGRRAGLVCSLTRLVHFGRLPEDIRRKSEAVAAVDAAMIAATRPGRSLGEIFHIAMEAYARAGYPEEWRLHHQGGPAGYEPREYLAYPDSTDQVSLGQAYAWNPSITGSKSEDTILVGENGNEIITAIPDWPKVVSDGIERPAILVV